MGDLSYLPGYGVPHHYHTGGAEETQIMLSGELECWVDGKRTNVYPGDTVTALVTTGFPIGSETSIITISFDAVLIKPTFTVISSPTLYSF